MISTVLYRLDKQSSYDLSILFPMQNHTVKSKSSFDVENKLTIHCGTIPSIEGTNLEVCSLFISLFLLPEMTEMS